MLDKRFFINFQTLIINNFQDVYKFYHKIFFIHIVDILRLEIIMIKSELSEEKFILNVFEDLKQHLKVVYKFKLKVV